VRVLQEDAAGAGAHRRVDVLWVVAWTVGSMLPILGPGDSCSPPST
jgi:hypothetical protein